MGIYDGIEDLDFGPTEEEVEQATRPPEMAPMYVKGEDVFDTWSREWQRAKEEWDPLDIAAAPFRYGARQLANTESIPMEEETRNRLYAFGTGHKRYSEEELQRMDPMLAEKMRRDNLNQLETIPYTYHKMREAIPAAYGAVRRGLDKSGLSPFDGKDADFAEVGRQFNTLGKEVARGMGVSAIEFATSPVEQLSRDPLEFVSNAAVVLPHGAALGAGGKALIGGAKLTDALVTGAKAADLTRDAMRPTKIVGKAMEKTLYKSEWGTRAAQWLIDPNAGVDLATRKYVDDFYKGTPAKVGEVRVLQETLTAKITEEMSRRFKGAELKEAVNQRLREFHETFGSAQSLLDDQRTLMHQMSVIKDQAGDVINQRLDEMLMEGDIVGWTKLHNKALKRLGYKKRKGSSGPDTGKNTFDPELPTKLFEASKRIDVKFIDTRTGQSMSDIEWFARALDPDFEMPTGSEIGIQMGEGVSPAIKAYADDMLNMKRVLHDLGRERPDLIVNRRADGTPIMMSQKEIFAINAGSYTPDVYKVSKRGVASSEGGVTIDGGMLQKSKHKSKSYAEKREKGLHGWAVTWETAVPKQIRINGYYKMLQEISENASAALPATKLREMVAAGQAKASDWVQIPREMIDKKTGLSRYGALTGMMVKKPVYNRIRMAAKSTSKIDNWVRRIATSWKMMRVINNPASHAHALFDGAIKQIMDGGVPASMLAARKSLKNKDKWFASYVKSGASQDSARQIGALHDALDLGSDAMSYENLVKTGLEWVFDVDASFPEKAVRMSEYLARDVFGLKGKMQRLFVSLEEASRLAIYKRTVKKLAKRKYGKISLSNADIDAALADPNIVKAAAERVNMMQLDYADIPLAHQMASRYAIVPFIAYSWKASGLWADLNAVEPLKMQALRQMPRASRETMSEEERRRQDYAPLWRSGGLTQPIGDRDYNMKYLSPVPVPEEIVAHEGAGGFGTNPFKDGYKTDLPGPYGAIINPVFLGKSSMGTDISDDTGQRALEVLKATTPGYVSQFIHKVLPGMMGKSTVRGEDIDPVEGLQHIIGIRPHKPEEWKTIDQATRSFEHYKMEIERELKQKIIQSNGDPDVIKDAQKTYNRELRKSVNRLRYLMGRNKTSGGMP